MSFILFAITPILSAILAIVFLIISIIHIINMNELKSAISNAVATIFCTFVSISTSMNLTIPKPNIFPLDNETRTYVDDAEITILNETNLFDIYYSLDGTDPKYGNKFENTIIVSGSTTVCARNKFLWWWSDIVKSPYKFEKINFNNDYDPQLFGENSEEDKDKSDEPVTVIDVPYTGDPEMAKEWESTAEPEQTSSFEIDSETEPPTTEADVSTPSPTPTQVEESTNIGEGINTSQGYDLLTYVNQYRTEAGVGELTWNSNLEQEAQSIATAFATGESVSGFGAFYPIGRQCNGAKTAQKAVSDWITGNNYVPSEADALLNTGFTQMGGALYYLPNGNEYGYHYVWVICLL